MMNENGLTILQWNCRGIYRKLPELKKYLASFITRPDLLLLQERHLTQKYLPKIQGYNVFRKDKSACSGGLAIFARDNLQASEIRTTSSSNLEIQFIQVQNLHIYNIYIAPNCQLENRDLTFLNELPPRTVIVGDFNAHHLFLEYPSQSHEQPTWPQTHQII